MPLWTSEPPTNPDRFALQIIRTPANGVLDAIVTSLEITGCYTHFVQYRTIPCEGQEECDFCQEGHSFRWHGYVACVIPKTYEQVLYEFTAIAGQTLSHFRTLHQSMRCCRFKALRPSGRANGRIKITCALHDENQMQLPKPPDVQKILCHIWNIPVPATVKRYDPDHICDGIGVGPGNGDGRVRLPKIAK